MAYSDLQRRQLLLVFGSRTGTTYTNTVDDTASATDSVVALKTAVATVADTATGTDSVIGVGVAVAATTDTATSSDSAVGVGIDVASVSDTATGTDGTATAVERVYENDVLDSASASDSVVTTTTSVGSISDTATATDSVTHTKTSSSPVVDSAATSDSASGLVIGDVTIADSATSSDGASAVETSTVSILDTTDYTDSVEHSIEGQLYDNAEYLDEVVTSSTMHSLASTTAAASDGAVGFLVQEAAAISTASFTDSTSSTVEFASPIADVADVIDAVTSETTAISEILDSIVALDEASFASYYDSTAETVVESSDETSALMEHVLEIFDTSETVDEPSSVADFTVSVDDLGVFESQATSSGIYEYVILDGSHLRDTTISALGRRVYQVEVNLPPASLRGSVQVRGIERPAPFGAGGFVVVKNPAPGRVTGSGIIKK